MHQTVMSKIADRNLPNGANISAIAHLLLTTFREIPFMQHTAGEMLFEGWSFSGLVRLINILAQLLGVEIGDLPDDPHFSYLSEVCLVKFIN